MSSRRYLLLSVLLLTTTLLLTACNLPTTRLEDAPTTPTPWIIYVTATPEAGIAELNPLTITPAAGTPAIGPFGSASLPEQGATAVEPTIDLSSLTVIPTPAQATPSPGITQTTATAQPSPTATPMPTATPTPTQAAATSVPAPASGSLRLGLNFVNSPHLVASRERIDAGLATGAGWNRFPIYWYDIEPRADRYNWAEYDRVVREDVMSGLNTDAILLGAPPAQADSRGVPNGLYEPVFTDGTDAPGSGKTISSSNPWAEFVYAVVRRYKPGGVRALAEGWPSGHGVRVWEIWNEPDFTLFWRGNVDEYARLVKVAYLAARHADPEAQIMLGGLMLFEQPGFLIELLNVFKDDPNPVLGTYPFQIVALHTYSHPYDTFSAVQRAESLLAIYGISDRAIWVNESGVAVWDDYPGPTWASRADQLTWRASQREQASYVIENAAYAFMAGADVVFHFQLYDDCGNQPNGTTFPPNDGSLCESGAVCWGDALGLIRNNSDNACFNQHPDPNTPRPAYDAFRTVGEVFGAGDLVPLSASRGVSGDQIWLTFARPATGDLIIVLWNESGAASEAVIPARESEATLIAADGTRTTLQPGEDGAYHIPLEPATNRNQTPGSYAGYMIGGPPVLFVEHSPSPVVSVAPLLERSRPAFLIRWHSSDLTLVRYEVWYRDESGGEWARWFETDRPGEALFVGGSGRIYSFFARGMAADGTWTADQPFVQARTTID